MDRSTRLMCNQFTVILYRLFLELLLAVCRAERAVLGIISQASRFDAFLLSIFSDEEWSFVSPITIQGQFGFLERLTLIADGS